jgi:serine/threonine-protein phosphatase 5
VVILEPKNDVVRSQLVSAQKLVRKIEFEKVKKDGTRYAITYLCRLQAIEVEEEKSAVERCLEIIGEGELSLLHF